VIVQVAGDAVALGHQRDLIAQDLAAGQLEGERDRAGEHRRHADKSSGTFPQAFGPDRWQLHSQK